MNKITIAIDGYSSCGKSTMAKDLAKEIGYIYIDSGAMYRCVTLFALENNILKGNEIDSERLKGLLDSIKISFILDEQSKKPLTCLNGVVVEDKIRSMEVSSYVSPIATLGFVREELVRQQQQMGKEKGIVMDGREIGTVVFPDAELKIFVTASPEIRAQRRYKELQDKGIQETMSAVLANVKERDDRDQHRKESPLKKANDALLLDNSDLDKNQQMDIVRQWFLERTKE